MSGGNACKCKQRDIPIGDRKWVVIARKCNHSRFNGYHEARSDYSEVFCQECWASWRTKSSYVRDLKDGTYGKERMV